MTETDWQETAARMRREDKATTAEIAEAVGRSESQVRKVLAKANAERAINGAPEQNGHAIPGQTDIERMLSGDVPPGDDPEYEPPGQEMDGGDVVYVEEIRVDGTTQLGMFNAGGKAPESASLRLSGGKIMLVDGRAFRKGDTIHFSGTAVVREVGQRDRPDPKTGVVVSAEQKHVAQITDLRVD